LNRINKEFDYDRIGKIAREYRARTDGVRGQTVGADTVSCFLFNFFEEE